MYTYVTFFPCILNCCCSLSFVKFVFVWLVVSPLVCFSFRFKFISTYNKYYLYVFAPV